MQMSRKRAGLAAVGLSCFLAFLCVMGVSRVAHGGRDAWRDNLLRVGVAPDYAPVIFKQGDRIVGLEADLANMLSLELGRPVKFEEMSWEELIPALLDDRIDIIMSGLTDTKSRRVRIGFSEPYLRTGQMAIMRRADEQKYNARDKILDMDKRIAVQLDSTGDVFVQEYCTNAIKMAYSLATDAALDLQRKRVELFIYDAPGAAWIASEQEADLVVFPEPLTEEYLAWGIRKDNQPLIDQVNAALEKWRQNGSLNRVLQRWLPFGMKKPTMQTKSL